MLFGRRIIVSSFAETSLGPFSRQHVWSIDPRPRSYAWLTRTPALIPRLLGVREHRSEVKRVRRGLRQPFPLAGLSTTVSRHVRLSCTASGRVRHKTCKSTTRRETLVPVLCWRGPMAKKDPGALVLNEIGGSCYFGAFSSSTNLSFTRNVHRETTEFVEVLFSNEFVVCLHLTTLEQQTEMENEWHSVGAIPTDQSSNQWTPQR